VAERSLKTDILSVFSTNIVSLVIALLIGIVLPRELGPEAAGLYFAILVIPQLTQSLIDLGSRPAIIYFVGKKLQTEEKMISALIFIFSVSTIVCIVLYCFIFYLLDNPQYSTSLIILIILITPLRLIISYGSAFILAKEKIKKFNRLNWLFPATNLLGIIVFVSILKLSVWGAILSLLCASFIVAVYSLSIILKDNKLSFGFDFKLVTGIYKLGVVYALSFFIIRLNYRVDVFLMERLSTLKEIGYYSLGVNFAELLFQIPTALWIVIATRSANASDQNVMTATVLKLLRVAILIAVICAVVLYIIAPYIIPFVFGLKYIPSISVVQYILPGILFIIVFKVLNGHLSGIGKPYISALVFIPSVFINIGLNFLWIPDYGAMGAVMATNISYTIGAILLIVVYCKYMKVSVLELVKFKRTDFDFIVSIRKKILGR
jgi:O-antigen/teichoic acid export membrane protein